MKQLIILFIFLLTGSDASKAKYQDTIVKPESRAAVIVDTSIYNVPVNPELDKQAQNMERLKEEAKDLYKESLKLHRKVKANNEVEDVFTNYRKIVNQPQ